jgi:hypothetical protein
MKRTHWPTLYAQLRVGWWWILLDTSAATATAALCGFFVWARQFDVNIALQSP